MSDIINIGRQFIDLVKQSGVPIQQAYLFGSFAKGHPGPDSDIDICIISDQLGLDFIDEMVKLRKLSLKLDDRIEPIPFNPADFADKYDPLAAEIRTHGIPLT